MDVRETIDRFGTSFGWPWVPVKFRTFVPDERPAELRFCEAVREAQRLPVVLTADSIACPGAKRSFGWSQGLDEGLAEHLATQQLLPLAIARRAIRHVPKLTDGVVAVELGTSDTPDVLVSFAQPTTVMRIVRAHERSGRKPLTPVLSSVMSACGNVAARSYLRREAALSFGCDTSREASEIGRDRLMVGVHWDLVADLLAAID